MAKIDVSLIEGYAEMTAEQKLAALEGFEFEVSKGDTGELDRYKQAVSKANSESAAWKRKYQEKLSEDERKAEQEEESRKELMKELESLREERAIAGHKASFLALGYEEQAALEAAKALHKGEFDTFFANQKKFLEEQKKAAKSGALDSQPGLSKGAAEGAGDGEAVSIAKQIGAQKASATKTYNDILKNYVK